MGLIGFSEEHQVGFGNASVQIENSREFLVTGTQTGQIEELKQKHLTRVTDFDLEQNELWCEGPVKASSESMTHGLIYDLSEGIGAVLHGHHAGMWRNCLNAAPTTPEHIPYGTPEMALAVRELYQNSDLEKNRFFVMGGHEDGVFAFGENLEAAFAVLKKYFDAI